MRRLLIALGALLLLAGLLWPWLARLPFGRLPGDFVIDRPGLRFYFPLATSIILSLVLSLLVWLLRR
ncbi:MAG: DUF2905 domain-containing protein [Gammaproteobacteria bacterium]|nr:DUF2905 domain-containing protein [Gammaproteobacteria bacterium]